MGLLAIGAGASEGLDQMLARMLSEQQLQRLKDAQTETARHNQADEALKGRQIDVMGQARQDALKAAAEGKTNIESDKQASRDQSTLKMTPIGSDIPSTLRLRAIQSGAAVPANFGFEPANMGRSTPEGELGPTPTRSPWLGTEAGQSAAQKLVDAESKTPTPKNPVAVHTVENGKPVTKYIDANEVEGQSFPSFQQPTTVPIIVMGADNKPTVVGNTQRGSIMRTEPGAAQAAQEQRTTGKTQDILNQLDRAIEDAKDLIGPGEGRVSSLEQMIGSADPRIQALGVKMKGAKMSVDHAITGSVRAGASPMLMQQWDNILANKITPEGLKAGVQAMREIVGAGSGGGAAPSGAKRIVYDSNGTRIE